MSLSSHPLEADLNDILTHTEELWEDLRGERIFITGATGFVGCWLLESVLWANDAFALDAEIVALTRRPEDFSRRLPHLATHPRVCLHRGDVRTFAFPSGSFSHVIHAAANVVSRTTPGESQDVFDTVVEGTRRTLAFFQQCGAARLLFLSSGAVYGPQPASIRALSEDYAGRPDATHPGAAYAEAKRAAEQLCVLGAREHRFEAKIARGFTFVGPYLGLDTPYAIASFVRDRLAGRPICVNSAGTARRTYLYAADLAIWLWTILFKAPSARPYNVGSAQDVSVAEAAHVVATAVEPVLSVVIEGKPQRSGGAERYVPSVERAHRELGVSCRIDLAEAIRRTVNWHQRGAVT